MAEPAVAVAIKELVAAQFLTNAAVTYYTQPGGLAGACTRVTSFIIANQDTASHSFTIHKIPPGGAAANSNKIFPAITIAPNTTYVWNASGDSELTTIPNGGAIAAFADANSVVTLTMSGKEIQ
jgi:hypothetical protein